MRDLGSLFSHMLLWFTDDIELGGAISANYRGFFSISCLLFDILRGGNGPLNGLDIWFKGPFQILGG